jgi:hypothetical protein
MPANDKPTGFSEEFWEADEEYQTLLDARANALTPSGTRLLAFPLTTQDWPNVLPFRVTQVQEPGMRGVRLTVDGAVSHPGDVPYVSIILERGVLREDGTFERPPGFRTETTTIRLPLELWDFIRCHTVSDDGDESSLIPVPSDEESYSLAWRYSMRYAQDAGVSDGSERFPGSRLKNAQRIH